MTTTLAAGSSTGSQLWFITRSSALVSFVLLTIGLVLGMYATRRSSTGMRRFVNQALHRNVTLLALGLVLVHIATVAMDSFVPIGWAAAVVPFTSGYRPTWVAAGTVAFDLAILLVLTSLARVRFGLRLWRVVHWLAYVLWPLTFVHYLGAGTDMKAAWGRWLAISAAVVVAAAAAARVVAAGSAARRAPAPRPARGAPVRRPAAVRPGGSVLASGSPHAPTRPGAR